MQTTFENKDKSAVVILVKEKDCKGSVKFSNAEFDAALSSVYINRAFAGVRDAKRVKVTIEVLES